MTAETSPGISVLLPVSGAAPHLAAAVDSILSQTRGDLELLLVDDGADEAARKRVETYSDPRIRMVRHDHPIGAGPTLAEAVGLARGAYFALMPADGAADPERLARQVAFLEAHPDFQLDPFPHPLTGSATDGTLLIWPQDADSDAMFIARMVRGA